MKEFVIIVSLFAFCVVRCEGGFAPSQTEEKSLMNCVRNSPETERCFGKSHRRKRNIDLEDLDLAPANEYVCSLSDFLNTKQTASNVNRAVVNFGSCTSSFPGVTATWRKFLAQRGDEIRIHPPSWQQQSNQSKIVVQFHNNNLTQAWNQDPERLKAVDVIISKARDDEIYGKYSLTVSVRHASDGEGIIHHTIQATCPAASRRFFVAGLNDQGVAATRNWFARIGNTMEFIVEITARKILPANNLQHGLHTIPRNYDIGPKVSAIILHFDTPSFVKGPISDGMIFPSKAARIPRSIISSACRRVTYIVSNRNYKHVVSPERYDIGECVGSCDRALYSSVNLRLNATSHALNMLWEIQKKPRAGNADATVCCIPISYRRFHYILFDSDSILMGAVSDDTITEYCGCR